MGREELGGLRGMKGAWGRQNSWTEEYRFGDMKRPSQKVQEGLERTQEFGSLGAGVGG